jgi:endonuclease/exonuclease/phosphatase family metal-dependent hydrolase
MIAALTVVVVTFNLYHGGPWSEWNRDDGHLERRFEIVAGELERLGPDVVALQEASIGRRRGHVTRRLAERLGMQWAHADATGRVFHFRPLGWLATGLIGFSEGPAILSRFPIVATETIDLPRCRRWYDPRVVLAATLRTPLGDLLAYSTHVSRDDCQLARIGEIVRARRNGLPSLVMGDFNATESASAVEALRTAGFVDAFRAANPEAPGATVWQPIHSPTATASRRVDFILMLPGHEIAARVPQSRVALNTPIRREDGGTLWPSDHHGVLATITMAPIPAAPR